MLLGTEKKNSSWKTTPYAACQQAFRVKRNKKNKSKEKSRLILQTMFTYLKII